MKKDLKNFYLGLLGFTIVLCAAHYYIIYLFFSETPLYFPIWSIYLFNITLVAIVYTFIRLKDNKGKMNSFTLFLMLTMIKMALAIIFLLPLFSGKPEDTTLEVFNFFIPYFFFLSLEIFSLNNFLQNQ